MRGIDLGGDRLGRLPRPRFEQRPAWIADDSALDGAGAAADHERLDDQLAAVAAQLRAVDSVG
ncbi:hypothetical protein [Nocardia sp. NPDC060259]|uniref:hypothetical protein n=1 Tax=Nocardia sp. NPDC060259 TaxID=3347088 RepID=UPI00365F70E1